MARFERPRITSYEWSIVTLLQDRRTDGTAVANTVLAMRALRHAAKTAF